MAVSCSSSSSSSYFSDTDSNVSTPYSSEFSDGESASGLSTGEILPYQFEPELSSDGDSPEDAPSTETPDDSSVDRVGNVNW